jgi:hypothetical protein
MTTACLKATFRDAEIGLRRLGNARAADRAWPRGPQPARRTVVFGTPPADSKPGEGQDSLRSAEEPR